MAAAASMIVDMLVSINNTNISYSQKKQIKRPDMAVVARVERGGLLSDVKSPVTSFTSIKFNDSKR